MLSLSCWTSNPSSGAILGTALLCSLQKQPNHNHKPDQGPCSHNLHQGPCSHNLHQGPVLHDHNHDSNQGKFLLFGCEREKDRTFWKDILLSFGA